MADALCGPSNALQNFKQHTGVDRSLQQDRLAGPRTSAQGFRTRDPRAGTLDEDFRAFENATANPFPEAFVGDNFTAQPYMRQPMAPNWTTEFQQMRISDQPLPVQQFRAHAPLVTSTNSAMSQEWLKQQQGHRDSMQSSKGKQPAFEQMNVLENTQGVGHAFSSSIYPHQPPMQMQYSSWNPQSQENEQINGADWSQAFEEAFQDAFQEAEKVEQTEKSQTTILHEDGAYTNDHSVDLQSDQRRIGSDAIRYTETKDRNPNQETDDANKLALVAGELLYNVQHDSSEKFQNSQFLDLMRKIRDREVEVKNNDFEATGAASDHSLTRQGQDISSLGDQDIRTAPADPVQDQDTFAFPNMDAVHAPREADYVDYTFDSDQFPSQVRNQMSDLHPGGRMYPGRSPPPPQATVRMSGAVDDSVGNLVGESQRYAA